MKTNIFYFSGTGNSLKVSRDIAEQLGNTSIIPIDTLFNKEVDLNCDCIGIVFPVYMWGVPRIVKEFIKKINTEKYVFAVATYGV
ncbi:MAG: EFR1 family ferrodoxin, partial [Bacillota bacterium]|nr:EFR1 family ferrodoxin [Bacillota bacterium]